MQIHIPVPEYQPNNTKIYGKKNSPKGNFDNGKSKSKEDGPRRNDIIRGDMKAKLKVSNLDSSVKAADMTELFSEFGKLKWTKLNRDNLGQSLGSAYIGKISDKVFFTEMALLLMLKLVRPGAIFLQL